MIWPWANIEVGLSQKLTQSLELELQLLTGVQISLYALSHLGEEGQEASTRYVNEQVTAVGIWNPVWLGPLDDHVGLVPPCLSQG